MLDLVEAEAHKKAGKFTLNSSMIFTAASVGPKLNSTYCSSKHRQQNTHAYIYLFKIKPDQPLLFPPLQITDLNFTPTFNLQQY